jgi:hypothetical protein
MTRFSSGKAKLSLVEDRMWTFDFDTNSRGRAKTLLDVRDELRVKSALRRAVNRDFAPQSLIDAIKKGIRG